MDRASAVPVNLENEIRSIAAHTPKPADLTHDEQETLRSRIKALLKEKDAVLVMHYYVAEELQILADETGGHVADSLSMADFGNQHPASTLSGGGCALYG